MGADTIRAATGSEQVEGLDETAGQGKEREREGDRERERNCVKAAPV